MNHKITLLFSLLLLGFVTSRGQAPITGVDTLCATSFTFLSDADPGGTWSASNTIVVVDPSTGVVTGTGIQGSTVITYATATTTVTTTVTAFVVPDITGPTTVCEGATIALTDGFLLGGTWSSLNTSVATVGSTGIVTGVAGGSATIHFDGQCGPKEYVITVIPATTAIISTTTTVCTNSTIALSDATPGGTWTSSSTSIADVSSTGVVGGVNPGTAVISYSNGCGTATVSITVLQTPSSISGLNTLCQGSSGVFVSSPAGGTWSSSNPTMVPINTTTGVVPPAAGIGFGTAVITYTSTNGCFSTLALIIGDCPPCPVNSDFELGDFSNWYFYHNNGASAGTPIAPATILTTTPPPTTAPARLRPCLFALTGGPIPPADIAGVDPAGGFPVVGAGVYSLRIGSNRSLYWGGKAVYYVHVPASATNYSLIYRFAVVLEDPGHSAAQEPKFTAQAYDLPPGTVDSLHGGTAVACAQYLYSAEIVSTFPDFTRTNGSTVALGAWDRTTCGAATTGTTIYVKPWATTSINLAGLGGHTIRMEFASGDCGQGGHYGYGYVDMTCGTFAIASLGCGDSIATVSAPSGFANYSWYDSTTFTVLYGTTQTVTFPMPTSPTTYAVIMTPYTGFGCPDTLYTRIRPSNLQINPSPDTSICAGNSATLSTGATDIALPLTYVWTPSSTLSCATCATPVATPLAGVTIYTASVTDDAGCNKIATQKVFVDSVTGTTTVAATSCFGFADGSATVTPTSGVGAITYAWSTVPAQTTSVATGLVAGTYSVSLTDGMGCTGNVLSTITQPPRLTMAIGGTTNDTTCNGANGSITLTGDFTPGNTYTVRYLFTATGTTTTVAVTTVPAITADASGNVVILNLPKGTYDSISIVTTGCPYNTLGPIVLVDPANPALPYVSSNSPICLGTDLHLITTDVTPGVTYTWAGPNGFASTLQTPTIVSTPFVDSGWYVVTVMVHNCFSKDSTKVIVKPNPFPVASSNTDKCSGDTLKLYGSVSSLGADVYLWNGPGSYISNFQDPIIPDVTTGASGIYTLTVTYNGCSTMTTTSVNIIQTPAPPTVTDTNYCQYDFPPSFIAPALTAGGTNLTWYANPTGGPALGAAPTPSTATEGITTWYVTQTSATNPPCPSGRAPISVGVYKLPAPNFVITDSVYCQGTYFTFEATNVNTGPDFQGVTWSFGPDSIQNVNPIVRAFNDPGPTTVSVNVYYRVCPDATLMHNIMVYPYPVVNLGLDTSICPGSEALVIGDHINNGDPLASWLWNTGETTPDINVVAPGTFYTKVTINGCSTTDTIEVRNDCYMNIPNVFSPNGDGVNDYFYPRQFLTRGLTSFSMNIYNRWGQVVFTTNSIDGRGWDGKYNDVPQPEGVYVYVIEATFKDGQKEHHKGNITLLR